MALEKYDLTGRVALITGAAGLLGEEHARALLDAGADVVLTDINREKLLQQREHLLSFGYKKISVYKMDVSSERNVTAVHRKLEEKEIAISILVNNAAIDPKVTEEFSSSETSRLENFSLFQWNQEIAVGLTGAFICSKVFGSSMAKNGSGGVILNIASDLSVIAPYQKLYNKRGISQWNQPVKPVTYSVIKSGLVGLTRYLATYWPDLGVRCNALSPGGVENGQNAEFIEKLNSLIPMGRMATKSEYHSVVQFLCSDASQYLNGQNIVMDGGRSVW